MKQQRSDGWVYPRLTSTSECLFRIGQLTPSVPMGIAFAHRLSNSQIHVKSGFQEVCCYTKGSEGHVNGIAPALCPIPPPILNSVFLSYQRSIPPTPSLMDSDSNTRAEDFVVRVSQGAVASTANSLGIYAGRLRDRAAQDAACSLPPRRLGCCIGINSRALPSPLLRRWLLPSLLPHKESAHDGNL